MIALVITAGYFAGWLFVAAGVTRALARSDRYAGCCHARGYRFSFHKLCRESHAENCWRVTDPRPSLTTLLQGSGAALIWPLLLPLGLVYFMAQHDSLPKATRRRALLDADIARLEREAGIR